MFHGLNMVWFHGTRRGAVLCPTSNELFQDYLRLQGTFLSQSCNQQLFLGIISISNSIFSHYHSEGIHRPHDLSIIHFQIHRERQRKDVLMVSLGMFQTSPTCCSSKSYDQFSSKTTFANITGSNFPIRCLERESLEIHSTEKSFTKRSLI